MIVHSARELAIYMRDSRKQQKLSQTEAGDRVGIDQSTVSGFENNPEGTKLETLFRLLSSLELELEIVSISAQKGKSGWKEEW
jgi:HTH-type transcriptional regulator / antitoxin HipB